MMKKLLENSANQLFRYRGQIPIILVLLAILVIYFNHSITFFEYLFGQKTTTVLTLSLVFIGHLIRSLVVGFRGLHTSGQNRHEQVAEDLNTTGLYSIVRHPLYLGNFFIWMGVFLWLGNICFLLFGCIFFSLLYLPIMKLENNFLKNKFGQKYAKWSAKTPLFVPNFRLFQKTKNSFSFKLVWKNEYPGLVSTFSSLWFISFLRFIFSEERIGISLSLFVFACIILVFGLVSRYLKHKTQFFPKMG